MNKLLKPLPALKVGEEGVVKEYNKGSGLHQRLMDIGLIKGTKVSCLLKGPSGDPSAFLIRGAVIALRNEDCSYILVEV